MAPRRKRMLDDGDDSDSSANSEADVDFDSNNRDAQEERELFENPYRKKRKTNGKEDALYGIFAESDEEEGGKRTAKKRSDWTKAPAFVTSDKPVKLDDAMQVDEDANKSDESDAQEDSGDSESDAQADESDSSRAPSPRVRIEEEEEEEELPKPLGGIGSKATAPDLPSFSKGGIGSGGIGSKPKFNDAPIASPTPSAFASRNQSFTRASANPSPKPSVALPASEIHHFSKIQGTFGARMLAKMGWQAGTGLGAAGEGIVTPVESKLRPQKMGIAFKGFKEKTEQSKLEAKRRGEEISDEEVDEKTKKMRRKANEQEKKRSDVWKRPKKVKTKVEHKTYEQIIAEAGEDAPVSGIGQIIDATGAVPREVSSLADINLNSWAPSNDPTRIPEVRHNIRLIADACKTDLDGLAREAKALQERKKFVNAEDARLRKRVEDEAELIARMQQIQLVTSEISATARELSSLYEPTLEPFSPHFTKLINQYAFEYDKYHLDEIVVAAMAPVMRRLVANWEPLEDPSSSFLPTFRVWKRALKVNEPETKPETQVDVYGSKTTFARPIDADKPMTPFESLLWNVWLPKVRTSLNNAWSAEEPQPAVKLYEAWVTFLPRFISDNILDQLILPKVQKAVAEWNMKKSAVSLRAIVFPWLPHVGLRLEDVLGDARRKVKSVLRAWVVDEPIPTDLGAWREVFDASEWDAILLKYVVPKLSSSLRTDFRVNPREQDLTPLHRVLPWAALIRSSIFSQILEAEFFPKWLDVLHMWLTQPRFSFEDVGKWYEKWKEIFSKEVQEMPGVKRGFTRALQLMNEAMVLGVEAPTRLAKPDFMKEVETPAVKKPAAATARPSARTHEITFRSIVEEFAASHNLLFIPTGKAHERSRMPLFRVSRTADGKKGLVVYIFDDAVWAPVAKADVGSVNANVETDEFKAISLEDMVLRVT